MKETNMNLDWTKLNQALSFIDEHKSYLEKIGIPSDTAVAVKTSIKDLMWMTNIKQVPFLANDDWMTECDAELDHVKSADGSQKEVWYLLLKPGNTLTNHMNEKGQLSRVIFQSKTCPGEHVGLYANKSHQIQKFRTCLTANSPKALAEFIREKGYKFKSLKCNSDIIELYISAMNTMKQGS